MFGCAPWDELKAALQRALSDDALRVVMWARP
jgi:hypothetical protein